MKHNLYMERTPPTRRDSVQCAAIRYGMDHYGEACTCLCHQWSDDDDEY